MGSMEENRGVYLAYLQEFYDKAPYNRVIAGVALTTFADLALRHDLPLTLDKGETIDDFVLSVRLKGALPHGGVLPPIYKGLRVVYWAEARELKFEVPVLVEA